MPAQVLWKVIESSTVTDEGLEAILNEWVAQGWKFEGGADGR